jgi:hypothetical protein
MSVPKQLAKRRRLEKKRLRKREARAANQRKPSRLSCLTDAFDLPYAVLGPSRGLKMSEVMQDFVAPAMEPDLDRPALLQLYSMAETAWNIALEPEHRHDTLIDTAIRDRLKRPTTLERESCREFLRCLVDRKLDYFAADNRSILAFKLDDLEDGGHYLSVVSGLLS